MYWQIAPGPYTPTLYRPPASTNIVHRIEVISNGAFGFSICGVKIHGKVDGRLAGLPYDVPGIFVGRFAVGSAKRLAEPANRVIVVLKDADDP